MKLPITCLTWVAVAWGALMLGLSSCSSTTTPHAEASAHSGFFPPLIYPIGERRPYWKAGLGTRRLESVSHVRRLDDGSRVYTITCESQPPLYLWDRISKQYNSPAVASQYSNFWTYATLDIENLAFLENIHTQLLKILPKPHSPELDKLIRKLSDAIHDARRPSDAI
ncbi:hypothetical protein [Roseimicrobium sp. ORNL1]|uniref:hypothetical protein n=1 Tax=Roseimicrobium sp. ORNL1 TaxID=2711231 RepID=UPI0013E1F310|nr:hypothetical protein [Roseimicrobium sp. ORNL1]QIF00480.1 hypothetical protein G5S37_02730 [Roseimicrobium sp. ORNL1]